MCVCVGVGVCCQLPAWRAARPSTTLTRLNETDPTVDTASSYLPDLRTSSSSIAEGAGAEQYTHLTQLSSVVLINENSGLADSDLSRVRAR
jgi:hypothetical protein